MKSILHSKPWIIESDISAVLNVLNSGMLAQGNRTQEFELLVSRWVGVENSGVAVSSGAAALVLALSALNIGAGDEVIIPTYVCSTVLEAVLTSCATPILCDVGDNWVVTPDNVVGCITANTKAIIVPHMYGIFADVESFRKFGIPIIEDCAQAIDYKGKRKIYGDIAIFSFNTVKCLTTGEGGMAVSADPDLVAVMRAKRDGSTKADMSRLFSPMSDISASLGISQFFRYHKVLDRRKILALKYRLALEKIIPDSLQYMESEKSMFYRFPLKIDGGLDTYKDLFSEKNICIRRGVDKLLHRLVCMDDEKFMMSVELFNTTISLPIYPALTDEEHSYCVSSAVEIFNDVIRNK